MQGSDSQAAAAGSECPQREVGAVTVIAQIEHPRKSWSGEARVAPQSVRLLRTQQVFNAAPHSLRLDYAGCQKPEQRPGAVVGSARDGLPGAFGGVAVIALAPATVGILPQLQKTDSASYRRVIGGDARLRERPQDRPGPVHVVRAPSAEPRAVGFLLRAQVSEG